MRVAVTSLCEFAARRGDLDYRYTPAPSAREGIAGHRRLQRRRGNHYQAELRLEGVCEGLQLYGRADGYDTHAGRLEEIKTYRGNLDHLPEAQRVLHRAQLHAYGALLCMSEGLDGIELRLTYYDIGRDRESCEDQYLDVDTLLGELAALCRAYLDWHEQELAHRRRRDAALAQLVFPFSEFRGGQRELSESVYKTLYLKRLLLLQAPTGIGKTVGTLFPALMAMARGALDRVFYLSSRNTVRRLALDGLLRIVDAQPEVLPLRVLEFSARTYSCEHPDSACHGESCPLAKGFFDRLALARQSAVEYPGILAQQQLRMIALEHEICPYYLAQEMCRWCDLVIADVNRYFDQSAILHALTMQNNWKVALLVDEAHNLIGRARGMYSSELSQQRLLAVKRGAPKSLKAPLQRLARQWTALLAEQGLNTPGSTCGDKEIQLKNIPSELCGAAHGAIAAIGDYLADNRGDADLQELLFELGTFLGLAESFAAHSLCSLSRQRRARGRLIIHNLVPADFLAPRFENACAGILFSATLAPADYQRDLLGLPDETRWQEIASPFDATQLKVKLATHISTRLAHRKSSIEPIVDEIIVQYRKRPANYLVYFSSFAYLQAVYSRFVERYPDISAWRQAPGMAERARREFIKRFSETGQGIGFAVLGGAFAEGIDLPGERLYGVLIATLGLPPFDARHKILQQRLQARYARGYEYTWLYPGLQKVVQAAGRVIRSPEDLGIVVLIDDRFSRPEVQALLPGWWPDPAGD